VIAPRAPGAAAAIGFLVLACSHDLRRVPDQPLRQLPPSDMQAVWAAVAERDRARAEMEHHERALDDLDRELAIADKDLEQADLELSKQQIAEDLARDSKNPDRLNTAYKAKARAGLGRKVAEAHTFYLRQRGVWLRASRDAARAHARAADARAEHERARLCAKKGLRPSDDFQPAPFAAQWQHEHATWQAARDAASREEAAMRMHEKRWHDLATEARALGGG